VKRFLHWPSFLIAMAVAALLAYGVNAWFGLNFWIAFGIAVVALLIVGWLAVIEDEMPGGFNNPKTDQDKKQ